MHVIRAIQGQQALELLKVHAIDLVILDIKLPKKWLGSINRFKTVQQYSCDHAHRYGRFRQ